MDLTRLDIAPLGDSALRIACGPLDDAETAARVAEVAARLGEVPIEGVRDIVPAWTSVALFYDAPLVAELTGCVSPYEQMRKSVRQRLGSSARAATKTLSHEVAIPVVYGGRWGPDLDEVASHSGLSADQVVDRHAGATYRVRAVGFTPGFAYLEGLPSELATPRKESPRTRVPAGSVGIGGAQSGIYPLESPGGWQLLGRTPEVMFDPERNPAPRLKVGDRVKFVPIDEGEWPPAVAEESDSPEQLGEPVAQVEHGGLLTLVQDQGRWGRQHWGLTPGGAMAALAAQVANLLVGNRPEAAVLEAALQGPRLRWLAPATVAVVGGEVAGISMGRPFEVAPGELLDLSQIVQGARCVLAVRGGIAASEVLGGRGTHLQLRCGGYQGRALVAGDIIARASDTQGPCPPSGQWFVEPERIIPPHPNGGIRVVRGPQGDWFSRETWQRLLSEPYRVSRRSDRMGIRLEGVPLKWSTEGEMSSEPVVTGAIQVPRDGQPILLGADRQTIGGYPIIACVASVDWERLAQLRPGDEVRFVEVSHHEAEQLALQQHHGLARLRAGLRHHD